MAKAIGLIGHISGRTGNMVFSKGPNGKTIVRPYQPIVANPRTSAQIEQRAKMNASGRFSRLWSKAVLSPLGGTALTNRSMFTSNLLRNARWYNDAQNAQIVPDLVEFSNGAQPLPYDNPTLTITADGTRSNINIRAMVPAHTPAGILRTMVALIPSTESDTPASGVMVTTAVPSNDTDSEVAVNVTIRGILASDAQDPDATSRYHAWLVGWTPTTESGRQTYERLVTLADSNGRISAEVDTMTTQGGAWSKTAYLGSVTVPFPA